MPSQSLSYPFSVTVPAGTAQPPTPALGPAWLRDLPVGEWSEILDTSPVDPVTKRWRPAIEAAYIEAGLLPSEDPRAVTYGRIGGIGEYSGAGFRQASSHILLFGGGGAGSGASNGVLGLSMVSDIPAWEQIVKPTHVSHLWPRRVGPTNEYLKNGDPNSQHSGYRPVFFDQDDMMIVAGASQTWELDAGNFANVNAWTWEEKAWHTRVTNTFIDPACGSYAGNALRAIDQASGNWWGIVNAAYSIMKWTRTAAPDAATPWMPKGYYTQLWKKFKTRSPRSVGGTMCVDTDRRILMVMMGFNWAIDIDDPLHASQEGVEFGGSSGPSFSVFRLGTLVYVPDAVGGAYSGQYMIFDWGSSNLYTLAYGGDLNSWTCELVPLTLLPPVFLADGYSRFMVDRTLGCLYLVAGMAPSNDLWRNIWVFRLR